MRLRTGGWGLPALVIASALAMPPTSSAAHAFSPPPPAVPDRRPVVKAADTGIDIVRIPPKSQTKETLPNKDPLPKPPDPRKDQTASQPLGRFYKLPVKLGSVSNDAQKGWIGVNLDTLDLPLALSLGLVNANGTLIVDTTAGGPAVQAGVRFGDIVVSANGTVVTNSADLRQKVASAAPGTQMVLEVWRATADDGDFLQTLRRLADGGNAYVMYRLGRMHAAGIGVARDDLEAVRWYRKGADAGNPNAMSALAQMLLEGRGTGKDPQEAMKWLKAASDKGNLDAMHSLGLIHLEGKLTSKDGLEAARLLTKGAEAGHTPSMVDLGLMYDNGNGVQQDFAKAAQWYKRAADLGHSAGMVNLGFLHARGKGVEQNDAVAVSWYRKAAALGNAAGIHNLAAMTDNGRGLDRDPDLAADLMLQALEKRYDFSYKQMTQSSKNWSVQFRRALQTKLRTAGVYSGNIDGEFGDSTITAIDAYINRKK
jgi:TPR repeat protein